MLHSREVWSFFSGGMGLDLGFERAGLAPTLAVEIDKHCSATIRHNRPDTCLIEGSVAGLDEHWLRKARNYQGEVFLMIGGPPCQSFSSGGNRAALSDPRGNLIYEYMRLVSQVRPRFFLLENVANLVTAAVKHRKIADRPGKHWNLKAYGEGKFDHVESDVKPLDDDELSGTAVRQILKDFDSLGYRVTLGVLNAADFGAPQNRLRFVMLGSRDNLALPLPTVTHGSSLGLAPFRTVRDAISDLATNPGIHSSYTDQVASYFNHIPAGGNWRDLPEHLKREAMGASLDAGGGKTGFYRRLAWDAPSPTITGKANRKATAICHPEFTRPLSVKECARLQGFPDDWHFVGSMAPQYLQIGNAVPVHLGVACAGVFKEAAAMKPQTNSVSWAFDVDKMLEDAIKRLRASARNKVSAKGRGLPLFNEDAA